MRRVLLLVVALGLLATACSTGRAEGTGREEEVHGEAAHQEPPLPPVPLEGPAVAREDGAAGAAADVAAPPPWPEPLPPDVPPVPPTTPASPFVDTTADPLSTFGLDVDTGSYTLARHLLGDARLPDPATVRTEEFVNAFDQGYAAPADGAFAVHADGAPWPFAQVPGHQLLRIGLATPAPEVRDAASLVVVVDTSGSMGQSGRLDLVRDAPRILVESLDGDDRVAIVRYSDTAQVLLGSTPVSEPDAILTALAGLTAEGSTNLAAGLDLGYAIAREAFLEGGTNRVVLASDGIANVGATTPEAILEQVADDAAAGIELVTVGVGLEGYNDPLMERLADTGDGFSAYVDGLAEAERLFRTDLVATLQTVALEARAQVVFDPAGVVGYRLLGYENRAIADEDFRDDAVDAGEVGAGHQVTALYEVALAPGATATTRLATVQVRWTDPATGAVSEVAHDVTADDLAGAFTDADPHLQVDGVVAAWAEALRRTGHVTTDLAVLAVEAERVAGLIDSDQVRELATLVARSAAL